MGLHITPTIDMLRSQSQSIPFGNTIERIASIRREISVNRKEESTDNNQIESLEQELVSAYQQLASEAAQKVGN